MGGLVQKQTVRDEAYVDFGAVLGPKLLLDTGCVKLGEKNCVHLPSVGEQTANELPNFTQPIASNNFGPSTHRVCMNLNHTRTTLG